MPWLSETNMQCKSSPVQIWWSGLGLSVGPGCEFDKVSAIWVGKGMGCGWGGDVGHFVACGATLKAVYGNMGVKSEGR
jgi:hypothetical protein